MAAMNILHGFKPYLRQLRVGGRTCTIHCCQHNESGKCALLVGARRTVKPCAHFEQKGSTTLNTCDACADGCGCKVAGWPSPV